MVSLVEVSKKASTPPKTTQDAKRAYRNQRNVSTALAAGTAGSALAGPSVARYAGKKIAAKYGGQSTLAAALADAPKQKLLSRGRLKSLAVPAAAAGVLGANAVNAQRELSNVREGEDHGRRFALHTARDDRNKSVLNAGVKSAATLGGAAGAVMGHRAVRAGLPGGKITRLVGGVGAAVTAPSAVKGVLNSRSKQRKLSELRREGDVGKSLKRKVALSVAGGAVGGAGAVVHGGRVADSYSAKRASGEYKSSKGLQREVSAGGEGKKPPSKRAFDTLNPSVNRWQDKFQNAEGIRTAGKGELSTADHWLRPKKSAASSDRKIIEQYVGSSRERKLKRGMALDAKSAKVGTELKHEGLSSWADRKSGLPDQYAGYAAVRASVPGSKWARDNPGATRARVVTGEGKAGDITNYSDIYRKANEGRKYRSRELVAEPGVVGRVSRKAKPFDASMWRKGLSAKGE